MRMVFLVAFVAMLATKASASNFEFASPPGPFSVGLRIADLYDRSRSFEGDPARSGGGARPIQAMIWYPAQPGGQPMRYRQLIEIAAGEDDFDRGESERNRIVSEDLARKSKRLPGELVAQEMMRPTGSVRDAQSRTGRFPIVVYAPSANASAYENDVLCEYLASYGYIVIASPSMGEKSRQMTLDLEGAEAQAADIEFLIGHAETLPDADPRHVAVAGFSWGGISNVVAAARDSRIKALICLDGSVRYFSSLVNGGATAAKGVLAERLEIPMLSLARPFNLEWNQQNKTDISYSFITHMKHSDIFSVVLFPLGHGDFSSSQDRFAPESDMTREADIGDFNSYTRQEKSIAYSWMARYVLAFLDGYLKKDQEGLAFMHRRPEQNGVPNHMILIESRRADR